MLGLILSSLDAVAMAFTDAARKKVLDRGAEVGLVSVWCKIISCLVFGLVIDGAGDEKVVQTAAKIARRGLLGKHQVDERLHFGKHARFVVRRSGNRSAESRRSFPNRNRP